MVSTVTRNVPCSYKENKRSLNFLSVTEHEVAFSRLDYDAAVNAYKLTCRRVFFLDLNGMSILFHL